MARAGAWGRRCHLMQLTPTAAHHEHRHVAALDLHPLDSLQLQGDAKVIFRARGHDEDGVSPAHLGAKLACRNALEQVGNVHHEHTHFKEGAACTHRGCLATLR